MNLLHILLIDDDEETLDQLAGLLPDELADAAKEDGLDIKVVVDRYSDFDEAIERIRLIRYDLVISDIYQGHARGRDQSVDEARAQQVVEAIQKSRFSPILLYTSSSRPEWLTDGPFLRYADKGASGDGQLVPAAMNLIRTGIPIAARAIHDGMDIDSAGYVWGFFQDNYEALNEPTKLSHQEVERILKRRIVTAMSRIDSATGGEASTVSGNEYYIYPKISQNEFRLGEILKGSDGYRVILTPHCQLHVQRGDSKPKTDAVLTAKLVSAKETLQALPRKKWDVGKAIRGEVGKPAGRYFFLPRLLDMEDSFCDFTQVESLPFEMLGEEYEPYAVLDTPFAENLQARFASFYSSVGTPDLDSKEFSERLLESNEVDCPG